MSTWSIFHSRTFQQIGHVVSCETGRPTHVTIKRFRCSPFSDSCWAQKRRQILNMIFAVTSTTVSLQKPFVYCQVVDLKRSAVSWSGTERRPIKVETVLLAAGRAAGGAQRATQEPIVEEARLHVEWREEGAHLVLTLYSLALSFAWRKWEQC